MRPLLIDEMIKNTYQAPGHGVASKEVHTVRSELMRLMDPKTTAKSPEGAIALKQSTSNSKTAAHRDIAQQFADLAYGNVLEEVTAEILEGLESIIDMAAQFVTKISTQKYTLSCEGLSDLAAAFDHTSADMEAHPLHSRALRAKPGSLDGKRILLIHQPLVVINGKSDGSDYTCRRREKKAIAWMG